ncbi:MAG TPA: hypothetical protein VL326_38760 [Kofleriaceae bacterium]|nr:hypothetical protein [Kofleriaceae bacterium]
MRLVSMVVATAVAVTGCATTSYKIPASELNRIANQPPEQRGQHVRVMQELDDADVGPAQPVTSETQVVFFPQINVYGPYERRRYYQTNSSWGCGGCSGGSWGGGGGGGGSSGGHKSGGGGKGFNFNGGGGDAKGAAVVVLVAAAVALVAVAAVEGSRFDGYANLHPMHPVYMTGKNGEHIVLPLAWIDPETARWTDKAVIRSTEGPWQPLERAALDRQGWTYGMYGGVGTFESADGKKDNGTATTIQLGYFPVHEVGIVGSIFFGWRQNAVDQTLFESRYTLELQGYPIHTGPVQFGGYIGGGGAYRFEDGIPGGNSGSGALIGGGMIQLDINTRLALTARFGLTHAHDERMSDAMVGLAVY